jgi:signal transduction histidine kinase
LRQLSLQLAGTSDPETVAKISERIRLTCERSLRLVNGLSKTARLEEALFKLEPVVVNSVARDVAEELAPLALALDQRIEVKPHKTILAIGHFDLIRTILSGLIDNSLMSHQPEDNNHIEIKFKDHGDNLQIAVRDYGETIDRQQLKTVLSNFSYAPAPIPTRPNSTGLGLFIAAKFTEYMNGQLTIVRHRRGGLTFLVTLPASRQLSLV